MPKPPFAVKFPTEFPFESQIVDADNNVVFELQYNFFSNCFDEVAFIESVVETLNKPIPQP